MATLALCSSAQLEGLLGRRPAYCRPLRLPQKRQELKERGSGPLGSFNKNYMALTRAGAKRFPTLVEPARTCAVHHAIRANLSRPSLQQQRTKRSFPQTTIGLCTSNGDSCESCTATTDLGPSITPRYINEVVCRSQYSFCRSGRGVCGTSAVHQTFLRKAGQCGSDGTEKLESYTQPIRTCCQCLLLF